MKILCFTSMYPTTEAPHGGVFITKRVEALRTMGHHVDLFAIVVSDSPLVNWLRRRVLKQDVQAIRRQDKIKAPNSDVEYSAIDVRLGVIGKILNLLTGYKYQGFKTYIKVRKKLKKFDCDVIHAHWLYPTGYAIQKYANFCSRPCVVTCHGSDVNVLLNNKSMKTHIIKTLKRVQTVEFVSKALLTKAKEHGYQGSNASVIPNGIDKVPGIKTNLKSKIIVGFVGNLIPIKRADKLPEIIRHIKTSFDGEVEFHIIGDGDLKETLEKDLQCENVKFFGRISHAEVLKKMGQMSVLMLPSRNEGWPCVVLEAHSCGVPVVGSANGGVPEAIGDERLVVSEDDFELKFAQTVLKIIQQELVIDRVALVNRAKGYMWENLQGKTVDNYHELLKKGIDNENT